jgi:hypothetical protein
LSTNGSLAAYISYNTMPNEKTSALKEKIENVKIIDFYLCVRESLKIII